MKNLKEKQYLLVHDYTVDKALDKTKRIAIEKINDTDDKLPDDINEKKMLWH